VSTTGDTYLDGLLGGDLELSRGRELNDSGNADRLVDLHGERIKFVPGIGYHVWGDTHWKVDDSKELTRLARHVVETIRQQAEELKEERGTDDEMTKAYMRHAKASGQANKLRAMIEVAEADARIIIAAGQLDSDPYSLNTPSGTVNLRTGEIRAHNPADLITQITRAGYNQSAATPVFSEFLNRITNGSEERQRFLQRGVGHTLIGEVLEHRLLILQGDGANGKSTFVNAVTHALGDYAHVASADLLMAGRRGVEGATPTIAGLRGKRFVTVSETGEDAKLAIERVKAVTGGDVVTGRFLNQNPITFPPSHSIVLMTNHRPRVQDDSPAIWRRLLLVMFDVSIPEHEQDRDLERKLRAEQDGILAWQVAGAIEYLRTGLQPPADVLAETQQYRESENQFSAWLSECTEQAPLDYGEKASELLHSFNAWAKTNRAQPLTKMSMAERLKKSGLQHKEREDANYYLGIRLPESDSGQLGFPKDEQETGDHGDLYKELPTRARAHAQGQRLGNVSTISIESAPATTDPEPEPEVLFGLMPDDERDRFAPVTPSQLYSFEHEQRQPLPPPEDEAAEHDALLPTSHYDVHESRVVWEDRGNHDELPLLEDGGAS
jgi:putative DNA primase/helicase